MSFHHFRKPAIIILLIFFMAASSKAQFQFSCGDDSMRTLLTKIEPAYENMEQRANLQIARYLQEKKNQNQNEFYQQRTTADSVLTIPVVVHVVFPAGQPYGSGTNISYAQIRSQIEALNAAFSRTYPTYNGQVHPAYAADTKIQFCLARNTMDTSKWFAGPGGTEFGVRRYANNTGSFHHNITVSSANQLLGITHPSANSFPFDKYLNIWLVSTIGGGNNIMGYAPRPILPTYTLDGIVMRADIFGDNTKGAGYNLGFGLTQGKVLAHEAGHYLGLYHIFQGGCAGANAAGASSDACDLNGDMICDIEPCKTQNIYCTESVPNTCTANYATGTTTLDMINDYMSYADDDCMNTFTTNQAERMWASINLYRPELITVENLATTGVLGAGGCVPPFLNAQIKTDKAVYCAGKSISFTNPSQGNTANTFQWQFIGGTPANSNSRNASVTYNQPGNYKAILVVTDGNNTRTDSLLFTVADCKLDSSMLYMSHWYFGNFGSIDFSTGSPVQTNTALVNQSMQGESSYLGQLKFVAATVSISDSLGNLMCYSNGVSVWNKNHQKITSSPMFGKSDINASSGLCYIPYPGKKQKYFIAGVYPDFDETPSGVRFVLVDADSNTVTAYKEFSHPTLPNRFSQFLTVVPHCNGIDYWIITKGFGTNDTKFYSFLVDKNGIDPFQTPVVSSGFIQPGFGGGGNQLKSNRRGDKLILGSPHGYIGVAAGAIYDFDNRTGQLFAERLIPTVSGYNNIQTGVAFSPNGEYFYLMRSSNLATNGPPYWLFQYRMSDMQYKIISTRGFYFAASFQPGPDGQIYIATQGHYLSQIRNPDVWEGVSVIDSIIYMRQMDLSIQTGISIPAFIDARQPTATKPAFTAELFTCNKFRFSQCFTGYDITWDFGDGNSISGGNNVDHIYTSPGDFIVTLKLTLNGTLIGSATKKITVQPLAASIEGPEFVCTNANNATQYFGPIISDASYSWLVSNGRIIGPENLPYVDVLWNPAYSSGNLRLQITKQGCTVDTSKTISISKGATIIWSLPDSLCNNDSSIIITALPLGGIFAGTGVRNSTFSPAVAGIGNHTITYTYIEEGGCTVQATKQLKVGVCNIPVNTNTPCDNVFNSITIAPNPVTSILQLKSIYKLNFVQVYNGSGQKVAEGNLLNNKISLPTLAGGLYTVLIYCETNKTYRSLRFMVSQ